LDKCPKCGSEDLTIKKKIAIGKCEECGHEENIKLQSGFEQVINATYKILPKVVREAFISAQNVSFSLKERAAKVIIKEYYNEFRKVRTPAKLLRLVAKMMARLSVLWEFKQHGNLYGDEMTKYLVKNFTWKDKFSMLFGKNVKPQQNYNTSLGILWNRCLRHLAVELFHESIEQNLSKEEIDKKWREILMQIEEQDLSEENLTTIDSLLRTKGLDSVLAAEPGSNSITDMYNDQISPNLQFDRSSSFEKVKDAPSSRKQVKISRNSKIPTRTVSPPGELKSDESKKKESIRS